MTRTVRKALQLGRTARDLILLRRERFRPGLRAWPQVPNRKERRIMARKGFLHGADQWRSVRLEDASGRSTGRKVEKIDPELEKEIRQAMKFYGCTRKRAEWISRQVVT